MRRWRSVQRRALRAHYERKPPVQGALKKKENGGGVVLHLKRSEAERKLFKFRVFRDSEYI